VLLVVAVVGACGAPSDPPPTASPRPSPTAPPATLGPISPGPPTPVATPETIAVEDPSLIDVLPADLDGVPVVLESMAFEEALADRTFAASVEAAAFGVVAAGEDFASAIVARPVEGAYDEAWFRDWRESYDEGACGQAGGVARTAQAELGGRLVFITTCADGLRTYHAWLEERGLVVSVISLGEQRYGERLMAALRP
jgi:hypothetical protein